MYLREYETISIVDPTSGQDGLSKVLGRMREAIDKTGGREVRLEDWGRRSMAYRIRKHARGHYLYLVYLGSNATVAELERLLRITESCLKYQTVQRVQQVTVEDYNFDEVLGSNTSYAKPSALEGTSLGAPEEGKATWDDEPEEAAVPAPVAEAPAPAVEAAAEPAVEAAAEPAVEAAAEPVAEAAPEAQPTVEADTGESTDSTEDA